MQTSFDNKIWPMPFSYHFEYYTIPYIIQLGIKMFSIS